MAVPYELIEPSIDPLSRRNAPILSMTVWKLFWLFVRLGWTFGAGTAITALLQDELVRKRREISRSEFMGLYGLARIVPSGSTTALAVAIGHRYGGLLGTVAALVGLILPAFLLTVLLTIGRDLLQGTPAFALLNLTLMPAALAIVIVSTWSLAREFFYPSVELVLGILAAIGILVFHINAPILLVTGGLIGALTIRERNRDKEQTEQTRESESSESSA